MNISGTSSTTSSGSAVSQLSAASEPSTEDRFLKMLVAQMQNQDPLNPLDSAEVTSQMAQINTVTSLEKLNTSMSGLGTQFVQLQAMQGAALVGHDVAVEGNTLRVRDGAADAGFELANSADKVKIDITTEVDSLPLRLDTITAVSSFGNVLALELEGGDRVSYDAVWAFL